MSRSRMRGGMGVAVLMACMVVGPGCSQLQVPRIDPSGEHIFAQGPVRESPPNYRDEPGAPAAGDDVAVTLTPRTTVAPIGSEVVLVAGVVGPDNFLRVGRKLEWSLAQGGVGQFVAVGQKSFCDYLLGNNPTQKVDNSYALGTTSGKNVRLTRGTPGAGDNVLVQSGQGWITVSSPVEGTSHVTVFAPSVYSWDARKQSATIYWVDAQGRYPPPAINPAGTAHRLTTVVTRPSDQSPCVGWLVRYEIIGGPAAGFGPSLAQAIEVPTDQAGQATTEIAEKQPAPGTNRIRIQVIRPANLPGADGRRLVVDSGSTMKTWTAPAIAVRKTGPAVGAVGATLTYRTEVSNPGDLPAGDVVVAENVPDGLSYVSSNPAAEATTRQLVWRLGSLGPGQRRMIEVHYRAERPGSVTVCADVVAAGGLKASQCATTTVTAPTLQVTTSGPVQAALGSNVTFEILIANRSPAAATKLLIKDYYDPGLEHAEKANPIERDVPDVASGFAQRVHITFRAIKAGRQCHRVEVTGANGVRAKAEACVNVVEGTPGSPGARVTPPGTSPGPSPPAARSELLVQKTGPLERSVGQTAEFSIDVANTGSRTLTNLRVVDQCDANLVPTFASKGYGIEGGSGGWTADSRLVWTIASLGPGKTERLEVQCRCTSAAAKARNRVTVTSQEGVRADDETSLAIRPAAGGVPPGETAPGRAGPGSTAPGRTAPPAEAPGAAAASGLGLTLAGLSQPIKAGKDLTYEVRVTNGGRTADKSVSVVVTLPLAMTPVRLGTTGPEAAPQPTYDGQTVRFEPVPEVQPGETLVYRVRARTKLAGQYQVTAQVTSQNQREPVTKEETTEVLP